MWVRQKEPENSDAPLKGPTHRLTHMQTFALGSSGGSAGQEAQETYEERLNCVVLGQGLEGQPPLFLCWPLLQGSLLTGTFLPVLNPPHARPILKLHWPGEISYSILCLLGTLPHPTHKFSTGGPLPGGQPHPASSLGQQAVVLNSPAHTFCGRLLVVGHLFQPELQCLLGGLWGLRA